MKKLTVLLMVLFAFLLSSCSNTVTVTFDASGGSAVSSLTLEKGSTLSKLYPKSEKEGFDFVGWCDENCITIYNKDTVINEDVTLYAQWFTAIYYIYFELDLDIDLLPMSYTYPTDVYIPYASYDLDSYKEGYTFEGWYLDSSFYELLTLDSFDGVFPARDITLYAKYIPKTSNE